MATNGYARIGGVNAGVKLVDVNPNKTQSMSYGFYTNTYTLSTPQYISSFSIHGYKKIALYCGGNGTFYFRFLLDDGTYTQAISLTSNAWNSYIDIPDNAVAYQIYSSTNINGLLIYYSLLA